MKKMFFALMMLCVVLPLAGCGGGVDSEPLVVRQILSDDTVDGDVRRDAVSGSLTVTQVARDNVDTVLAGVEPGTLDEYRAFLHFPLAGIPVNAVIQSAVLDIVIRSIVAPTGSVPLLVELVSFPPPLLGSDYDRILLPPLASTAVRPITFADVNRHVTIDVTALMVQAQQRGLPNFQVRILEDFGFVSPGVIGIDDSTVDTAPLLTVAFF